MIINKFDKKLEAIRRRGETMQEEHLRRVTEILAAVKKDGDRAVYDFTMRFDRFDLSKEGMLVPHSAIRDAYSAIDGKLRKALEAAFERIRDFHALQLEKSWFHEKNGVLLGQKVTPLDRVGIYAPGGRAAYPSSVLMNAAPAVVAGVKEVVLFTPTPGGVLNPAVLSAAYIAGIDKIYRIGGAQAVGAMAYGTQTIPKVDKITGPGNIYVALAKKMVFGAVDIDMVAGPSEILVIADNSANPAWVASDMLSQAEHDELASCIAVTVSKNMAERIEAELKKQLALLPRKEIAEKSLAAYSAIIVADDLQEACRLSNDIAPEHLELCVEAPMELLPSIRHAGAVFMGHYTPEAVGDYFAGPNHVLPTGGSARFFSPLGVYDFVKRSSLIYYNAEALALQGEMIRTLAESEGLSAHANSLAVRLKK